MNEEVETFLADAGKELAHFGVKGMKWGVRRDERKLSDKDKALNLSQRSQVKLASGISALAAIGITSNAAATAFQLQSRWEHLQILKAVQDQALNSPYINDAGREALRLTRNRVVKGLIASAAMTTAISTTIGVVTHRTAKAYFAPLHKVYGDAKPKINSDLKRLGKDLKSGKVKMTPKQYHDEVAKIVAKHMTKDRSNILQPFHELARSQLGLEYNTKALNIKFNKLPNTNLYSKMTVTTPDGLKLVKAVRDVRHADEDDGVPFKDFDIYFDYKFDEDGYISEFSSPTLEIANDMLNGNFDFNEIERKFGDQSKLQHSQEFLEHFGVKGMKWGVRKDIIGVANLSRNEPIITVSGQGKPAASKEEHKVVAQATSDAVSKVLCDPKTGMFRPGSPATKLTDELTKKYVTPDNMPDKAKVEMNKKLDRIVEKEAQSHLPAGAIAKVVDTKFGVMLLVGSNKSEMENFAKSVLHSDAPVTGTALEYILDESGWPTGLRVSDSSTITHSKEVVRMTDTKAFIDLQGETSIEHFGIKGMKWGIRRTDAQLAKAAKVAQGEGRPNPRSPSDEGARAAAALKSLKKGGVQTLSNDDLQLLTTRLRLETSLAQAQADRITTLGKIDKQTKKLLGYGATVNSAINFATSPAGRLLGQKVFGVPKHTDVLTKLAKAGAGGNKLREDLGLIEPGGKKKK